jgi:branched-chain amino acid transport system permease protein
MMRHPNFVVAVVALLAIGGSLMLGRYGASLAYTVAIAGIGALSLNLLIGYCGQISFAHGALLGVGAYAAGSLGNAGADLFAVLGGGIAATLLSVLIGLPAMRLRGLYFAIATLAAQAILEYLFKTIEPLTNGVSGLLVKPLTVFGVAIATDQGYAVLAIICLAITWLVLSWLMRTHVGRAFLVVRESEIVARGMGIDVGRTKMTAFAISGFFAGVAGALLGFTARLAHPEMFGLALSVDYTAMIIVGGLGSQIGSIIGAVFVTLLPEFIQRAGESLHMADLTFAIRELMFGVLIIVFLVFEPRGLAALLRRRKAVRPRGAAAASAKTA